MPKPPLVYIAAPYSQSDPVANTHHVLSLADALLDAGAVPVVPHLTLLWQLVSPKPYEHWLQYDVHLLLRCDALLRVPGHSDGATREAGLAYDAGLDVLLPASSDPSECARIVKDWNELRSNAVQCHECEDFAEPQCHDCVRCLV